MKIKAKKQIKATELKKKQLANTEENYKNKLLTVKEKEVFKNIYNEDLDKIEELTKKINYGDLKFAVEKTGVGTNFSEKKTQLVFLTILRETK